MSKKQLTVSILIPCYNEEKSIEATIKSCLSQSVSVNEIVVVDDGSKDNTRKILNKYKKKLTLVYLPKNTGNKSYVQEEGLKHVTSEVFVSTDADTLLDFDFVKNILAGFTDRNTVAVAGYVKSMKGNLFTGAREMEYILGQDLHKNAQSIINSVLVIPGAAGAFRTKFFKKNISFDHDTLTEDLDFTYKIHKKRKKINFAKDAIVYTQDPDSLKVYVNQLRRWYAGGWQNLIKHHDILTYKKGHALELSLAYAEGFTFSLLLLVAPLFDIRFLLFHLLFLVPFALALALYSAVKRKRIGLLMSVPVYIFLSYVNAYIFVEQAFKEAILKKKNMVWYHPERRMVGV